MTLDPGIRFGPYEIGTLLGSGGMGEVYRARDTRLDREVAIKILPPAFARSPARRERFRREAQAISRLNHPNICALYDVGEDAGVSFLVMEYLDGESLDARLRAGALPVPEALDAAVQIGAALAAAHERGIVHRDLKPANIMLAASGVKLLDFGIAKLLDEDTSDPERVSGAATLTAEHQVVGTAAYMAPEQITGGIVDARADLFACGAVIYEMLTGRKAFDGASAAAVAAAVLTAHPSPVSSVAAVPPALDHVVRRALAKKPHDRWQTARDLMLELRWLRDASDSGNAVALRHGAAGPRRRIALTIAALAVAALGSVVAWRGRPPLPQSAAGPLTLLTIEAPAGTRLDQGYNGLAVSPDGLKVAFIATAGATKSVWLRELNSPTARRVLGTDGAISPFWSPDSQWLAFYHEGNRRISRVDLHGGRPQLITQLEQRGWAGQTPAACWMPDDTIVFARGSDLVRVPAAGGEPVPFASPDQTRNERAFFLPVPAGSDRVLFLVRGPQLLLESRVRTYAGQSVRVPAVLSNAVIAAGHMLFRQGSALVAQRYDEREARLTGQPVLLADGVRYNPGNGRTLFSASADVLAYRQASTRKLTWIDRAGRRLGSVGGGHDWNPSIAPDGSNRVVLDRHDPSTDGFQIWTIDDQGRGTAVTHGVKERFAVWSPDAQSIAFTRPSDEGGELCRTNVSGKLSVESLLHRPAGLASPVLDWTRDGHYLVYGYAGDLWALPLAGDRTPVRLTQTPAIESLARVSPDGKWIAYSTTPGPGAGVWVQRFLAPSEPLHISESGFEPNWRQDGNELYYMTAEGALMAVPVVAHDPLGFGPATELFRFDPGDAGVPLRVYAAAPDGRRFLVSEPVDADSPITVAVHWPALVRQ